MRPPKGEIERPSGRYTFWKATIWQPAAALGLIPYGLIGFAEFIRDHLTTPSFQQRWQLQKFIPALPWYLWVIGALAIIIVFVAEGSFRLWRREARKVDGLTNPQENSAPDVRLEGPDANAFTLRARGHACEIRVGPIVTELAIVGTMRYGNRMNRAVPRYAIEFPVVSDLCDGSKHLTPSLWVGEDNATSTRSAWPEDVTKSSALVEFFRMARFVRSSENGEPGFETLSQAESDAFTERQRQPFQFTFDITYWDSEHAQQWRRTEVLVYEPVLDRAYVRADGTPERLVAGAGVRP